MKRVSFLRYLLMLLALSILGAYIPAQAQLPLLDMTVTPGSQTAAPGAAPLWSVQLTNNTPDTAYFILTDFNEGFPVTLDVTVPGYNGLPLGSNQILAPNDSLTLTDLFQTQVATSASDALYNPTATLTYDLYDDNTFGNILANNLTAGADYQLTVQSPQAVPEPGSLVALGIGCCLAGMGFVRRKRRSLI